MTAPAALEVSGNLLPSAEFPDTEAGRPAKLTAVLATALAAPPALAKALAARGAAGSPTCLVCAAACLACAASISAAPGGWPPLCAGEVFGPLVFFFRKKPAGSIENSVFACECAAWERSSSLAPGVCPADHWLKQASQRCSRSSCVMAAFWWHLRICLARPSGSLSAMYLDCMVFQSGASQPLRWVASAAVPENGRGLPAAGAMALLPAKPASVARLECGE